MPDLMQGVHVSGRIQAPDQRRTAKTRRRYDRIAGIYDFMERGTEREFASWRAELWSRVTGPRVLEVGVGTGKNIPYYPDGYKITGIDISPGMLRRARVRARREGSEVLLREADAQALPFPDACFESVVATFVFCSVPDPTLALKELERVLTPDGQVLLLEHVLSRQPVLRPVMKLVNPLVVRMTGANIDRQTVEAVQRAGFADVLVEDLWLDIVKLISARKESG